MERTKEQIERQAKRLFPHWNSKQVFAYVRGYLDSQEAAKVPERSSSMEDIAKGLWKLWPSGEKDGKWAWRDSVPNLTKRLQFLWSEREFGDKFTVEDCLRAGRRYLAQFQQDTKYMQILKYFIFKQTSLVGSDGKIHYIYKSTLGDFLEDSQAQTEFSMIDDTESEMSEVSIIGQGELV